MYYNHKKYRHNIKEVSQIFTLEGYNSVFNILYASKFPSIIYCPVVFNEKAFTRSIYISFSTNWF